MTDQMEGKICLITGATSGIGRVTAVELARMGGRLIVVARSKSKGEETIKEIIRRTGSHTVDLLIADLSSQASVRQLAEQVKSTYRRVDVLLNNAGGVFKERQETVDGIEWTFAVNHLAYFLLTNLLLDELQAAPEARVINVASEAHRWGSINFKDIQSRIGYAPFAAYSQSKLANILFTYELARRLADTTITVNCLHPGVVATGFGHNNGGIFSLIFRLFSPFVLTPEEGAETGIYLASSAEARGVTGNYFRDKKAAPSSRESYNTGIAQELWRVCEDLTGLEPIAP